MCGISGLYGDFEEKHLIEMISSQHHRGPDDSGRESFQHRFPLFLGHNRLKIIDLSDYGHQPMFDEKRESCLVFNGEIYNYKKLRRLLKEKGIRFRSQTDSEVLLYGLKTEGVSFLQKCNGMFAFAFYDKAKVKLILARDRIGIKPLYYWYHDKELAFASELKALYQVPKIRASLTYDKVALFSYINRFWVAREQTPYQEIKKVLPGHFLEFDLSSGQLKEDIYWKLGLEEKNYVVEQHKENIRELFFRSIKRRMRSDVPVGAFLSGGLDSSAISVYMQKVQRELSVFTIAFDREDQRYEAMMDDAFYAERLAKKRDMNYHLIKASLKDVQLWLEKISYAMDEPIGDPAAIHTFLISRMAKDKGIDVLLSGQGSDEIFAGYRKYWAALLLKQYFSVMPEFLHRFLLSRIQSLRVRSEKKGYRINRWLKRIAFESPETTFDLYYRLQHFISLEKGKSLFTFGEELEINSQQERNIFQKGGGYFLDQMCYADVHTYLPNLNLHYCDRATMAASVECRVPFLDHELVEYAFCLNPQEKIKGRVGKWILNQVFENILPKEIIERPKMPFSSPIRSWVRSGFGGLTQDLLNGSRLKQQGIFDPAQVDFLLEEDKQGVQDHAHMIYGLINFQLWSEKLGLS